MLTLGKDIPAADPPYLITAIDILQPPLFQIAILLLIALQLLIGGI